LVWIGFWSCSEAVLNRFWSAWFVGVAAGLWGEPWWLGEMETRDQFWGRPGDAAATLGGLRPCNHGLCGFEERLEAC